MKFKHTLSAGAMLLTALSAGAQTQAPGLWESDADFPDFAQFP